MNNNNMELKVLKFEKGVTTAGDTWNDSAYDTIETPSELTYEFDGCESRCSDFGATKEELIAKAIKVESWNTWFYEMEGEYKTFQEVGLESPMVFVPEEDCEISVDGIGDFINNGKGLCPKSLYDKVKEQLLEIALNAVEITVVDENGEDITSQFSSQKMDGKIICENKIENVSFKLSSNDDKKQYQQLFVDDGKITDVIQVAPCDYFTAVNAIMFSETLEDVKERFNETWAKDNVNGFINYVIKTNGGD